MLPCINKQLFGMECLGCGIQRATLLVFRGDFVMAFKIYPAIYTLILLTVFLIFNLFVKFKYDEKLKIALIIINVSIIIISYFFKTTN
ncbi:uncharacterized protein DUF2752 [Gelidibacter sediminis]|uniref:Uncharacterized protein DUF2752 n=1 Tax=Gelidibacter sediminis TaxID=1608710 RepID=A0A4R7PZ30_9FLAO|nr:DUF2752 domain-containing protein [Gelidibacter sediminis]TDU40258.1 uncharacterized protein DUF2752 [Gelidibacter sediminis]